MCEKSLLFSASYATCPYYSVRYMQSRGRRAGARAVEHVHEKRAAPHHPAVAHRVHAGQGAVERDAFAVRGDPGRAGR